MSGNGPLGGAPRIERAPEEQPMAIVRKILRALKSLLMSLVNLILLPVRLLISLVKPKKKATRGAKKRPR